MGLDIYAWPLTRYYAKKFKNFIQHWADANV